MRPTTEQRASPNPRSSFRGGMHGSVGHPYLACWHEIAWRACMPDLMDHSAGKRRKWDVPAAGPPVGAPPPRVGLPGFQAASTGALPGYAPVGGSAPPAPPQMPQPGVSLPPGFSVNMAAFMGQRPGIGSAAPAPAQPPGVLSGDALKAAQAAALAAAQSFSSGVQPVARPPPRVVGMEISREVTINEACTENARAYLTKRTTHDDIGRRHNALVVLRGRYYPAGTPRDDKGEKPLFLKITPNAAMQVRVRMAVHCGCMRAKGGV